MEDPHGGLVKERFGAPAEGEATDAEHDAERDPKEIARRRRVLWSGLSTSPREAIGD